MSERISPMYWTILEVLQRYVTHLTAFGDSVMANPEKLAKEIAEELDKEGWM